MPRVRLHENIKVPVTKNIVWALKLIFKVDKKILLGSVLDQFCMRFFDMFVKNILFLKTILSVIDSGGSYQEFVSYLIKFLVLSIVLKTAENYGNYLSQSSAKTVLQKLNNMLFAKARSLEVACYEDPEFYDKYQRATNVITDGYFYSLCVEIAGIVGSFVSFVFVLAAVISVNPVYLLFLIPSMFVFAVELAKSKKVYKRNLAMTGNNRVKAYIRRTMFLKDFSKDMRTSNVFLVLMQRFEAAVKANLVILKEYGLPLFIYSTISSLLSEFIPIVGTYAFAGYQFIYTHTMTISGFSVVISAITSVERATQSLASSFDTISQMALYFSNLREFLESEPQMKSGEKDPGEFESLEFRNVSFRYAGADKDSLSDVSFTLKKGERIAVVGVNGAGKTTLVKLMMRFYDPTAGEILYNGVNIKEYDVEKYRLCFGAVFQDYRNFAVSVNENVICRECDENDKAFAEQAMRNSGAWDKVSKFPAKGDTVLTREFEKGGVGLSGGENQKLSTARLFAHPFEVAVLDEPSSALDPVAEYNMYENLVRATEGKTVVYISHRLSSAVLSDRVIVLSGGSVSEEGSHAELMESGGEYAEMFTKQADAYSSKTEVNPDE